MADHNAAEAERRQRWAAAENHHRQAEFQRAHAAWSRDDQLLAWMQSAARNGFQTERRPAATGFVAKRGEELFGSFGNCRLIEVRRGAGHYRGGSSGFSFRITRGVQYRVGGSAGSYVPGAQELRITDDGDVHISSTRVTFQGGKKSREWSYGKLLGLTHDPVRPITMIHVSNRQNASGIAYPPEHAPQFRFLLELGVARATGRTPGLIASLDAQRAEHARLRPLPPALATPDQAPARPSPLVGAATLLTGKAGQSPRRRILQTALVGGAALLALGGVANAMSPSTTAVPVAATATPDVTIVAAPTPAGPPPVTTTEASPIATTTPPSLDDPSATPSLDVPSATPSASPTSSPSPKDEAIGTVKLGARPTAPSYLRTNFPKERYGATCRDGSHSSATGSGACSHHHGVAIWLYTDSSKAIENKLINRDRKAKYNKALKAWNARKDHNDVLTRYPCSKGSYRKDSPGYRAWRDTNHNGIACG